MGLSAVLHDRLVHGRRVDRLAELLSSSLPSCRRLLDVGCGDGRITRAVADRSPGLDVTGIDVLVRPETAVPVSAYDGSRIPFDDDSFEVVMMVDVLHHSQDPLEVLREARRVASAAILVKDHCLDGLGAYATLRLMDYVGNAHHAVALPYNYWPRERWRAACAELGLTAASWQDRLGLYPAPVRPIFERSLHFIAVLEVP